MKIENKGFTLIELIVVTTIIIILTSSSSFYFFDFIGKQKINKELIYIEEHLETLDKGVEIYDIFDYELLFDIDKDYYIVSKNIFDASNPVTFSGGVFVGNSSGNIWELKVYKNHKLFKNLILLDNETYTGSFLDESSYHFHNTIDSKKLNSLHLHNFFTNNIHEPITLTAINTEEDKSGTSYNAIKITNIGGKKEIDNGNTDTIYLFFEQDGYEGYLLVTK